MLGLLFLKYVSDSFEELHAVLEKDECLDEEDHDEYFADTIFWVPKEARWSYLKINAKKRKIGQRVDQGMIAIEEKNEALKGILPKSIF